MTLQEIEALRLENEQLKAKLSRKGVNKGKAGRKPLNGVRAMTKAERAKRYYWDRKAKQKQSETHNDPTQ